MCSPFPSPLFFATMRTMNFWFATNNEHKKKELEAILGGISLHIPRDRGLSFNPEETGTSFVENALIKARALYELVKEPVIADDSGLCVDALGGRPGIHSARYGGKEGKRLDSHERNQLLLAEMAGIQDRRARFVCAMVLYFGRDRFYLVQETLEGELTTEERGNGGFGYDPILYVPQYGKTVAELSEEEKNRISHRGKAGRILRQILEQI